MVTVKIPSSSLSAISVCPFMVSLQNMGNGIPYHHLFIHIHLHSDTHSQKSVLMRDFLDDLFSHNKTVQ